MKVGDKFVRTSAWPPGFFEPGQVVTLTRYEAFSGLWYFKDFDGVERNDPERTFMNGKLYIPYRYAVVPQFTDLELPAGSLWKSKSKFGFYGEWALEPEVHVLMIAGHKLAAWHAGESVFVQLDGGSIHGFHAPARPPRIIYRYIRRKVAGQDCVLTVAYTDDKIGWSVNRIETDPQGRVDWSKSDRFSKVGGRTRAAAKLRATGFHIPRNVSTATLLAPIWNEIPERFRRDV